MGCGKPHPVGQSCQEAKAGVRTYHVEAWTRTRLRVTLPDSLTEEQRDIVLRHAWHATQDGTRPFKYLGETGLLDEPALAAIDAKAEAITPDPDEWLEIIDPDGHRCTLDTRDAAGQLTSDGVCWWAGHVPEADFTPALVRVIKPEES